jgi:hypothetical protein
MSWDIRYPERFGLEKLLLGRSYPNVKLVKKNGRWRIYITVRTRRNVYVGELIYPEGFPWAHIEPWLLHPKVGNCPHRFSNGMLCFYEPGDVGPETTGKVFCDWFVEWVRHYEHWLETGNWDELHWRV